MTDPVGQRNKQDWGGGPAGVTNSRMCVWLGYMLTLSCVFGGELLLVVVCNRRASCDIAMRDNNFIHASLTEMSLYSTHE
jgi:hypothetical protein